MRGQSGLRLVMTVCEPWPAVLWGKVGEGTIRAPTGNDSV